MILLVTCHNDAMIKFKSSHCLGQAVDFSLKILFVELVANLDKHIGSIISTSHNKITFTTMRVIIDMIAGISMPQRDKNDILQVPSHVRRVGK